RAICPFQNLYTVIGRMHGNTHKHSGSKKTFDVISKQYAYIPQSFIKVYVAQCTQCCIRRNFSAPVIREIIILKKFLQHVQVDLVSFEKYPDKKYQYIAHLQAAEVAAFLLSVFTVFGPPYILQSDNRREFTAQIIYELLSLWKEIYIINGHPCYPQSQGIIENSNKTLKNVLFVWMEDNNQRDWDTMNICRSRPTNYTLYELEDLPEGIIKNEEDSENEDNNLSDKYEDFNEITQINNMERDSASQSLIVASPSSSRSLILFSDIFQEEDSTIKENSTLQTNKSSLITSVLGEHKLEISAQDNFTSNQKRITKDKENQNFINSNNSNDYVPSKKHRIRVIQEVSNNLTSQHNIYWQVANKNLEDYCSKMKHQMHTKYNIHEYVYEVGDLVKIQVAKIDCGPGDHCALPCKVFAVLLRNMYRLVYRFGILDQAFLACVVLLLGPKEYPELDNPPTNTTVSIIKAAKLQSNTLASNKVCNCRGDCFTARYICKKANIVCESGCYLKNSKCKHQA
ncbi:5361_t:CDS:2, partial [Dentiscutata heterogama]